MARTTYEVAPDGSDWVVKRHGAGRAAARFSNKKPAVDRGVETCKNNKPSELIIKDRYGRIQDRRTYGDDPFPPRG